MSGEDTRVLPTGKLYHTGYVVQDIDAAVRHWVEQAGVGPFVLFENCCERPHHGRVHHAQPLQTVAGAELVHWPGIPSTTGPISTTAGAGRTMSAAPTLFGLDELNVKPSFELPCQASPP